MNTPPERTVLGTLEGRNIYVGDILYGLDGTQYRAALNDNLRFQKEYPMMLIDVEASTSCYTRSWGTGTHWEGRQVIFWIQRTPEQIREWTNEALSRKST
jgi:hypothetical protein